MNEFPPLEGNQFVVCVYGGYRFVGTRSAAGTKVDLQMLDSCFLHMRIQNIAHLSRFK